MSAEGIAATVQEIIRLEGELNRARARLAVCGAEERATEKKRFAQLCNLDISSMEAGDSPPALVQDLGRVAVRVTSRRRASISVPAGAVPSAPVKR